MQWRQTDGPRSGVVQAWGCMTFLSSILLMALAVLVLALFLVKLLWAWTVPDLFPGAVSEGLIAREISWLTAFKLALFMAVMAAITGIRGKRK